MEFKLAFNEAVEHLFKHNEKGWVQGENFAKDSYLTYKDGVVRVCTIGKDYSLAKTMDNVLLTRGLVEQKYRIIDVLNYENVSVNR